MMVIRTSVFTVIQRFPRSRDTIKHLYKGNNVFQNICEDYRKCLEAHRYWNKSGSKEASERREEYAMLQGELETEIIQSIAESNHI